MSGRVIVLNGTSSSGKTSVARCLQAIWPTPLLYIGLDTAIGMLPSAFTGSGPSAEEGYCLRPVSVGGRTAVSYTLGPHARFLNSKLATMANDLSSGGYDVIIDHIITDDETMLDLAQRVRDRPAFLIGVVCDGEVAKERERSRGDRMIGLVAGQVETVHSGVRPYDLTVDSTHDAPQQLAEAIQRFVSTSLPKAFCALQVSLEN